ncbi:FkbM family methyltransferase [Solidesulfovibrio carbinoliphilus]|nr:FkbM family methyltransferase [Solidesulfovibrio carbinoliphilus]
MPEAGRPSPDAEAAARLGEAAARIRQGPEYRAAKRFVRPGAVVFDVGAHRGAWSLAVAEGVPSVALHLFEPLPGAFAALGATILRHFPEARLRNLALADMAGRLRFHHYRESPTWSGFFRRRGEEARGSVGAPEVLTVACDTLDAYCRTEGIFHIDFLKIDVEGAEPAVLRGAAGLLAAGAVDALQFEYGGTFADARATLRSAFDFLALRDYVLFTEADGDFTPVETWSDRLEDYAYANYLAVHRRLAGWFLGRPPAMLDLGAELRSRGIRPRGVIHIGAHEGRELAAYRAMGASPVLFIEANPAVAARLERNVAGEPDVFVAVCAATDGAAETATLHVTSMDQSSSLLPLGEHLALYPGIVETDAITVPAVSLDALLDRLGLDPAAFNLINIDIQGAELVALRGAAATLPRIEAINAEINYRELYQGCVLSHQLDAFLAGFGFVREAAVCPYDPSWGDALYVRRSILSMADLGQNGRFANQLFQYAFLRRHAARHRLTAQVPAWVGNFLFGAADPPPPRALPLVRQTSPVPATDAVAGADPPVRNVDLSGYFQFHSSFYAADKAFFRSLFAPVPEIKAPLDAALDRLLAGRRTLVALHLRRGDYGYGHFFVAPSAWYRDWLAAVWPHLPDPLLYIASDEPEKVLPDFADYASASRADLGDLGTIDAVCPCYPDFHVLTRADGLAISNSSFSFAAAMQNDRATVFMRPRLGLGKLIPFDPFDAEVLFRDETVESHGAP